MIRISLIRRQMPGTGLAGFAQATVELDFFLAEAIEAHYDLREVILRDINESGILWKRRVRNRRQGLDVR
jgi:hypothetical protein